MKIALLQTNATDDPGANRAALCNMLGRAAEGGATFVASPEVSNIISTDRAHQDRVLRREAEDETLAALRAATADAGVTVLIGSLALKQDGGDGRFVNRSFLIGPDGAILARYDKIHMFDVEISETETYRESAGYRPGDRAGVVDAGFARIGMTVCYDVRFPGLYRALAKAGAQILTVPAAFSPVSGAAHWHVLLRARAIENGAFVIAPAQTGAHAVAHGKPRSTYGHSMVVGPWGEVILDAGTEAGVHFAEIDLDAVAEARKRIPSLDGDRSYTVAQ